MLKKRSQNWFLVVIGIVTVSISIFWIQTLLFVNEVEYLVFEGGGNGMENGKLYIKDKTKAQNVVQMFQHNPYFQHACGYWYELTAYNNAHQKIFQESLNGECDEYWFRNAEIQVFIADCRKQLSKEKK